MIFDGIVWLLVKVLDALYYYPYTIEPNCERRKNWLVYKKIHKFEDSMRGWKKEDEISCAVASETRDAWCEARQALRDLAWNRRIANGLHYLEKHPPKEILIYDWAMYDKCKIAKDKKSCSCGMIDSLADDQKYKQSAHGGGKVGFGDIQIYIPDMFLFGFPIRWNYQWIVTVNVEEIRKYDIAEGHGSDDYDAYEIFVKRSWLTVPVVTQETHKWLGKHFPTLKNIPVRFVSDKD